MTNDEFNKLLSKTRYSNFEVSDKKIIGNNPNAIVSPSLAELQKESKSLFIVDGKIIGAQG